jgi:hypothetical protein
VKLQYATTGGPADIVERLSERFHIYDAPNTNHANKHNDEINTNNANNTNIANKISIMKIIEIL